MFSFLPVKYILFKTLGINDDNEEEGEYQDWVENLKHYDVQNPITQRAGNSRINGRTLKDGIARGILKKLKKTAQTVGEVEIEDVATNGLGVQGFGLLVNMNKQQEKNDLLENDMIGAGRKTLKNLLPSPTKNGSRNLNDAVASFRNRSKSEEDQ